MQIYIFRSQTQRELCAFAGDVAGSQLPEKFAPWHATGVIRADREPPHKLPRDEIERAINDQGFQLWRMKPGAEQAKRRSQTMMQRDPASAARR